METNHSDFQHLFRLWREGIPTGWEKLPDDVRVEKIEFIKDFMKIHVLDSIDDLAYLAQADDRSIFARCEGIQGGVMFLDRWECPNAKVVRWMQQNREQDWSEKCDVEFK
jgi:hypothetical protein